MEADLTFQIVISIISVIVCPIICTVIMYFGKKIWERKRLDTNKQRVLLVGLQSLLRDRLLQGCFHYQQQGYSTYNARVNLTKMHEAYIELGGNSIELHEYEKFMELPHKPEEQVD